MHTHFHRAKKKEEARKKAVYPAVFKIVDERCIFNKKDPYILGVDVLEGTLKLGTPVVIPNKAWTGDAKTQDTSTDTIEFGQVRHIRFLCSTYLTHVYLVEYAARIIFAS